MNSWAADSAQKDGCIGFIGLGIMGTPMALNFVRAGIPLIVWNRSAEKCEPLRQAGAQVAKSLSEIFARAQTVCFMLFDEAATDAVLGRGTDAFAENMTGHLIINMGSVSPDWSRALAREIDAAGGYFVEAPVSGSRVPAETGQLVGLLAGAETDVDIAAHLFQAICCKTVKCGAIGNALLMKLAINQFLLAMTIGLAEAVHFAERSGLNLTTLKEAMDAGPMSSAVSRLRSEKLIKRDFTRQTSIVDALNITRLIANAAREIHVSSPLIDVCQTLLSESAELGLEELDMAAIVCALEKRSDTLAQE